MLKGTLLEAHSIDGLADAEGVFSGHHHLVDGRIALLMAIFLCGSYSAGLKLERHPTSEFRLLDGIVGEAWSGARSLYT